MLDKSVTCVLYSEVGPDIYLGPRHDIRTVSCQAPRVSHPTVWIHLRNLCEPIPSGNVRQWKKG